jgi:hypothetical protein
MSTPTFVRRLPVATRVGTAPPTAQAHARPGLIHAAILATVWMTFALSGIVFSEPAPVDALLMGLVLLLPAVGLVTVPPALGVYVSLWSIAAASGFLTSTLSRDVAASTTFTAVSLYLYIASFILAGFVAHRPVRHTQLMLDGWLWAAVIAASCGLVGYFNLVPGAYELFTKFDRVAGTFKDPNVFGPFLVAPFLYCVHLVLNRPIIQTLLPLGAAAILALGVLLSFSRGAWFNLGLGLAVYGVLAYATAGSARQREKIAMLVAAAAALIAVITLVVLQDDKIGSFLTDRASLTQSYDVGPAGRFGGQEKAIRLLLDHPFGIGAGQFTQVYHNEEVHNVFLSMFHNAGWLGGLTYWLMVGLTLVVGTRHIASVDAARPLFLIAYAAFLATALEGVIVDTDHWRSFYVLMAMVWGLASAPAADGAVGGGTVAHAA